MPLPIPASHTPKVPHVRQDRVRLTILVHRKPGTSVEEFQRYWREEHSALFAALPIVKTNLLKYEQSHTNDDVLSKVKDAGMSGLECDGMAIFEAVTWDKLLEVFSDPEYKNVIIPDEEKFLDRHRSSAIPSSRVDIFNDPT